MCTYFKAKHRTLNSKEIGLEVNADKINYSDTSANEDNSNSFGNHIR